MATRPVSFYLDEMLSPRIVEQLRRRDIDAIRGPLGADDSVHLARATEVGRVVCTFDDDFLKLAVPGVGHAGIIKGVKGRHSIGDWVRYLRLVHAVYDVDEMLNEVFFLFRVD